LQAASHIPVVLLVEDEWLVRMEIADALAEAGYRVVEMGSGEAALDYVASGAAIDLLLTDIRLTGAKTGWDIAESCRIHYPGVAVIYASANSVDTARMVEGSVFVGKPSRTEALIATCMRLIGRDGGP
jgi:CheY-like chemotaxis protein